ncbi:cytochrome P450 [Aetokthonos hydrillicola Thurmond2011]|jgi:cytochrome P450|uniref:Cytochrome P450 n=1 Tax=Aetokthonos hydrillicola Thurmond2011 TaxID=2712845 RepID=A0AAP5I5L4_9CYAN|nr:cytochrome P450 [Aetokthonos hydrillicola]MBO3458577.1 cytochrome P450 [Aetokthonos hydrillicola CCALA 1050]MBW4585020.1 cytochrome P450 [Aetokthonos hydrillicola CCALA 1050]MDR9894219.1 cytochrome P450 [Aetokthonos hydrillicola Thurmond2011]
MMIPLIQTLQLIVNPTKFLEDCAAKYGDSFTVNVLGINSPPVAFFSSPEAIVDCFSLPGEELDFQKATHVFRPLFGPNSIVLQEGHKHNRQRQLLLPPFHSDGMKTYGQIICRITEEVTQSWKKGATISIQQVMPDITLQIILQVVFGISHGQRYQQLKILLSSLLEDITKPWYSSLFFFPLLQKDFGAWSPWGNFLRRREQIDKLIYAEIYERRLLTDASRTDILSLLMSAVDENGEQMTDIELRDQLVSLLLLGYETTAAVLSWVFYLIHYHPHVKDKLMQELDTLGDEPQPEAKAKLPYLTAVCQEALRLHPIALICTPRQVKNTVEIAGQKFTSGTILVPCIHLAHRRAETYSEPEKFQPERFLNKKFSPFEYLPFGGGYRGCIGAAFSMYELKLIVATILSRFDLTLVDHRPVHPVRRGITIVPSGGVRMIITHIINKVSGKIALNSGKR